MENRIYEYLEKLEREKDIEILLACETGSRAWGFPSPDSDYDVRIIYRHKTDWYLSLSEHKDSVDLMYDDNLIDITGWDIRKALRLLYKSNASLIERIQSPIIYKEKEGFIKDIQEVASVLYSRKATIFHYLGLCKRSLSEIDINNEYKLKKLFYALRSAVACMWIVENEIMPPIVFTDTLEGITIDSDIKKRIYELIDIKLGKDETYLHRGEKDLFNYIEGCIDLAEDKAKELSTGDKTYNLDNFFRTIIKETV
jgi:predicted nucleotidyltransferase